MSEKAATPRRVKHSEKLDRLNRTRKEFCCKPFTHDSEKWENMRIASSPMLVKRAKEEGHKRMIREVQQGVQGLDFPAAEMAMIIRGWMAQDER